VGGEAFQADEVGLHLVGVEKILHQPKGKPKGEKEEEQQDEFGSVGQDISF